MSNEETKMLKQTSLFKGVTSREFENIINCIQPDIQSYRKGESIHLYANGLVKIGVVIAGRVSGHYVSTTGDRMLLFTVEAGDLLGVLYSFSGIWLNSISITADTNCSIAFIKPSFFASNGNCKNCCGGHQIIMNNLLSIVTQKGMYLYRRTIYLTMKNIRQKICALLYEEFLHHGNTTIMLTMQREALAEYFNIPRPSLSRELGQLKREGIIDFYKNVFRILDFQMIEQYAFGQKSGVPL